jgi:ergothioneine biosynthesis protein EgtB
MSAQTGARRPAAPAGDLGQDRSVDEYLHIRSRSEALAEPLEVEDQCIQTIPEVSPTKWHLAHVSWFFETFLLKPFLTGYREFHPRFGYLFNSYYYGVGHMHPRPNRGLLSRPTLDEVLAYRRHVDGYMQQLLKAPAHPQREEILLRCEVGLHHEQQHQELMVTDIKHVLASNPLQPAYAELPRSTGRAAPLRWLAFDGGLTEIGAAGKAFAYDNECPRHPVYLQPFRLASRPVSNGEYLAFVADGGYEHAEYWLADGWAVIGREGWRMPLYWEQHEGAWYEMTLGGLRQLDSEAPVAHLSYFEADAYARWAGGRLPTEAEWELAAQGVAVTGNFAGTGCLQPMPAEQPGAGELQQLYGDVWEWTQSPYVAYPGFRPLSGALGEYNGKFMCGQFVLRGGSCATPDGHIRATYRNFFYPHDRWQFSGLRLAEDCA